MRRNSEFKNFVSDVFLQPDVTPTLANYDPSVALQSTNDAAKHE